MLEPAIKYKEQFQKLQYDTWFNDKYKYWYASSYYEPITIDENTWYKHQFVSVKDGQVIGYISYEISRLNDKVDGLAIINFSDDKITFGLDLHKVLKNIFEKYKFRKLSFSVVIGNPVEAAYDKLVEKYGGRIVGVYKEDIKLVDNEYYDLKVYEILASDYFKLRSVNI